MEDAKRTKKVEGSVEGGHDLNNVSRGESERVRLALLPFLRRSTPNSPIHVRPARDPPHHQQHRVDPQPLCDLPSSQRHRLGHHPAVLLLRYARTRSSSLDLLLLCRRKEGSRRSRAGVPSWRSRGRSEGLEARRGGDRGGGVGRSKGRARRGGSDGSVGGGEAHGFGRRCRDRGSASGGVRGSGQG